MSSLDQFLGDRLSGKGKSAPSTQAPVYTGAYERLVLKAPDSHNLRVLMHKGKAVAVLYGDRVLPFVVEQVEQSKVASVQDVYRKGLAGLIAQIILHVAK